MAYQAGGKRDKHLRAGLIALGLGGTLWLLTTPGPPPGAQSYPAAPDGHAQRVVTERQVALRAQFEVIGSQQWLLTDPQFNVLPGAQALPDTTRAGVRKQPDVLQVGAQQNLLLSPPAPAQDPFIPQDLANPLRVVRRVQPDVTGADLDLLTSPAANLTTAQQVFPDTTAAAKRQRAADVAQPGAQQNLLLSPAVPPADPFVPVTWLNPQGEVSFVNRTWIDSAARLIGQDTFYDGPGKAPVFDYPNPTLRKWSPIQRTWVESTVRLIGEDAIYGAPGEVPTYDWPNPRTPQRSVELRSWAQLGYLTALNPPAAVDPSVPSTAADYLRAMQSVLQASGYFSRVTIGEPDA